MRRQQKLAQEELALDLKLLEEALASYEGEENDRALRKVHWLTLESIIARFLFFFKLKA
jgi:hypothetical protein